MSFALGSKWRSKHCLIISSVICPTVAPRAHKCRPQNLFFRCGYSTSNTLLAVRPFSRNTRNQPKQVFDTLRELMTPPDQPRRPIGFVYPEDKNKKAES